VIEQGAVLLVDALSVYALLGVLFAFAFVSVGVTRIDSQAVGAGIAFRLLIFPGAVVFWPLLLRRWTAGRTEPPPERNPYR
jgi:hypothetical protein